MTARFAGLAAVVTGGASGIGAAVVRQLLEEGAGVAVLDRDVRGTPAGAIAIDVDLTDGPGVAAAVRHAAERLSGIDIVVNSAGIGAQGTVADDPDDEWHRVYDVNVVGAVRVIRAALPLLQASRNAAIVNVASVVATTGLPDRALYSASKGALVALTRAMAVDHLDDGIRVNCVSPGTADTPWVERLLAAAPDPEAARSRLVARQPHRRLVSPDEVAGAVLYLADPRSASTNGVALAVDGGLATLRPAR